MQQQEETTKVGKNSRVEAGSDQLSPETCAAALAVCWDTSGVADLCVSRSRLSVQAVQSESRSGLRPPDDTPKEGESWTKSRSSSRESEEAGTARADMPREDRSRAKAE